MCVYFAAAADDGAIFTAIDDKASNADVEAVEAKVTEVGTEMETKLALVQAFLTCSLLLVVLLLVVFALVLGYPPRRLVSVG